MACKKHIVICSNKEGDKGNKDENEKRGTDCSKRHQRSCFVKTSIDSPALMNSSMSL